MSETTQAVLRRANEALGRVSLAPESDGTGFACPPCFISAPPRGGSTLLQQVLISRFSFGYVSNLMARFWNAPEVGAALHAELRPADFVSTFDSRYGNTVGAFEPHEWGWFWRKWLALEGDEHHISRPVDWLGLKRVLVAIGHIQARPMLFDAPLACGDLALVDRELGGIFVLNLTRSPWHVCNSIINARLERYGTIDAYYGATTRHQDRILAIADPIEQIVIQARTLFDEQAEQIAAIPRTRVLDVAYENLRAAPMEVADRVARFYAGHGIELEGKPVTIEPFPDRNRNARVESAHVERLGELVRCHFPEAAFPAASGQS